MKGHTMEIRIRVRGPADQAGTLGSLIGERQISVGEPDLAAVSEVESEMSEMWEEIKFDQITEQLARTVGAMTAKRQMWEGNEYGVGWPDPGDHAAVEYDPQERTATFTIETPEALGVQVVVTLPADDD